MKIVVRSVNKYVVSDKDVNILIVKKPRKRCRQIIKAYYNSKKEK